MRIASTEKCREINHLLKSPSVGAEDATGDERLLQSWLPDLVVKFYKLMFVYPLEIL